MEARNLDPRAHIPIHAASELEQLQSASPETLRQRWYDAFGGTAPDDMSEGLLRLALSWRAQALVEGGLTQETRHRLMDLQFGLHLNPEFRLTPIGDLDPGSVLTREWKGRTHTVYVLQDRFAWEGRTYRSLTAVARAITGTHWPGPSFFGLYKPRNRVEAQ
jgi:hypothetical protein